MNINAVNLLPQMSATNSGSTGAQMLSDEASFQEQLKAASDKLNKSSASKKISTMTDAEVAKRNQEIREASVQLEAIMLKLMYNEMWKTVPKNELFGEVNNNAMDIYRDMYHEELTNQIAENGGIGLADFIYRQLTETNPHRLKY